MATSKLTQKHDREIAEAYQNISQAVDNASKSLAIALKEFKDKKNFTANDKKNYNRELLKHAKLAVKQIEKTNRLHIFIFKSTTGSWWKLGGNSVAIHRLMVGTYLDREISVNIDRDNFAVFKEGVICLQDEHRLEKDIAYSGAKLVADKDIDFGPFKDSIRAYRLTSPLSDREVRRFRKIDEEVLKNINTNIFSIAPDVEINNYITLALRESLNVERQVESNARNFVGHRLMDSLFDMRRAYYDVANHRKKDPERYAAMERIDICVGDAMTALANYADLNIANRSAIAKVSLELAKVRELVHQKVNRFNRHHEIVDQLELTSKEYPAPKKTTPPQLDPPAKSTKSAKSNPKTESSKDDNSSAG